MIFILPSILYPFLSFAWNLKVEMCVFYTNTCLFITGATYSGLRIPRGGARWRMMDKMGAILHIHLQPSSAGNVLYVTESMIL